MRHNLTYSDKNEIYSQSSQNSLEPQSYAHPRQINFLICRVCSWCASYLYWPFRAAEKCPMCDKDNPELYSSVVASVSRDTLPPGILMPERVKIVDVNDLLTLLYDVRNGIRPYELAKNIFT